MDFISLIEFLTGTLFLSIASYQDLKEREINPTIFLILGIFSFVFLIYRFSFNVQIIIMATIFFTSFLELERWDHLLNVSFIMLLIVFHNNPVIFINSILMIFYKYFYYLKLFGGKADMRAAMSITFLVPSYPDTFSPFQVHSSIVSLIFPFSIQVLFYATVINIIIYIPYLLYKNKKNNAVKFPDMLTKIYMDGKWIPYQAPFIFSMLIAFIVSFFIPLFSFIPS